MISTKLHLNNISIQRREIGYSVVLLDDVRVKRNPQSYILLLLLFKHMNIGTREH